MRFAFYRGDGSLVDHAIRWWQRGPYSHVEAVLSDNGDGTFECASSVRGTGVRIASIALPVAEWDLIDMPADAASVRAWFVAHVGASYDWLGIFGFVVRPVVAKHNHYFCSEAVASALGISEPWRLDSNGLADLLRAMSRIERVAG